MSEQNLCFLQREEHIAWINLNNQPVNALSRRMVEQFQECLEELKESDEIDDTAVVFIRSRVDETFSAGADLKERQSMDRDDVEDFVRLLRENVRDLYNLPVPTAALLNGPTLGGGFELALACDLRLASENATCGLPEVRLGLIPGAGGTQRLARLIGPADAKEMIFTGKRYSSRECYELGLFNRLLAPGNLLDEARTLGRTMSDNSIPAMSLAKRSINEGLERSLDEGLAIEWELYLETFDYIDRDEALENFRDRSS